MNLCCAFGILEDLFGISLHCLNSFVSNLVIIIVLRTQVSSDFTRDFESFGWIKGGLRGHQPGNGCTRPK